MFDTRYSKHKHGSLLHFHVLAPIQPPRHNLDIDKFSSFESKPFRIEFCYKPNITLTKLINSLVIMLRKGYRTIKKHAILLAWERYNIIFSRLFFQVFQSIYEVDPNIVYLGELYKFCSGCIVNF
ncbi:hypothetical protein BALU111458_25450 [Bacillus luti]